MSVTLANLLDEVRYFSFHWNCVKYRYVAVKNFSHGSTAGESIIFYSHSWHLFIQFASFVVDMVTFYRL